MNQLVLRKSLTLELPHVEKIHFQKQGYAISISIFFLGDDSALEEAKNQRSKEIPASAKARARKSSESSSVEDAKVRKSNIKPASDSEKSGNSRDSSPAVAVSTTKRKPGPKSKPKIGPAASKKGTETKSAVNTMAFSEGDSITCCEDCNRIFISKQVSISNDLNAY